MIVEDERHSRENLRLLLRDYCPRVELCGEAASVEEAVRVFREIQPELLFLDIELQDATGFDLLRRLPGIDAGVIFTTAFDQYAIQAIRFSSLDYLLKPIDIDELQQAVEKAIAWQDRSANQSRLEVLIAKLESRRPDIGQRICLSTSDGLEFLPVAEIVYCAAGGSYTTFFLRDGRKIVVSRNLKEFENLLEGYPFFRAHNSYLVNLLEVRRFVRGEGGYLQMSDQSNLPVSPRKREEFLERMAQLE